MKRITLDFSKVEDRESLHKYLEEQFEFPSYYGRNLDALWDLLSEIHDYTLIELQNIYSMYEKVDQYSVRLLKTLDDAAQENEYIWLKVKEDN